MPFNPKQIANMQARYDRLSSMDNRSRGQQAAMDRIGGRLNPAPSITGNAPMVQTPADVGMKPPFYYPPGVTRGVGPNDAPMGTGGPGRPFGGQIGGAASGTSAGMTMKKGGRVKSSAPSPKGASSATKASSASKRADGIAQRGKTKGRYI